jgi:hypothetical protein
MGKCKRTFQNGKERRSSPRVPASEVIPQNTARLATGQQVELVNFNLNGAILVRSAIVLNPGSYVHMRVDIPGSSINFAGRIHRCRIIAINRIKIQYEAAIILDEKLPLPLFAKVRKSVSDKSSSALLSLQDASFDMTALPEAVHS